MNLSNAAGPPAHTKRNLPLPNSAKMAAPAGLNSGQWLLLIQIIETTVFPLVTPRDAFSLITALGATLPESSYAFCDCTYQSGRPAIGPPTLLDGPNNDFLDSPPCLDFSGPVCVKRATSANPATVLHRHPMASTRPAFAPCLASSPSQVS